MAEKGNEGDIYGNDKQEDNYDEESLLNGHYYEKYPFELKDYAALKEARLQLDDKEWCIMASEVIRDLMAAAQLVLVASGDLEREGNQDFNNALWGLRAAIVDAEIIGLGE